MWTQSLAASGNFQSNFQLLSVNKEIEIRRVFFDIWITTNTHVHVPYDNGTLDNIYLSFNTGLTAGQFSEAFVLNGGTGFNQTGGGFRFTRPDLYEFNGFRIKNTVEFLLNVDNWSPDQHIYTISLVVTTLENIAY